MQVNSAPLVHNALVSLIDDQDVKIVLINQCLVHCDDQNLITHLSEHFSHLVHENLLRGYNCDPLAMHLVVFG